MRILETTLCCFLVMVMQTPFYKGFAQVVQLQPSQVTLQDSVTILYNAALGNGGLNNFQGDVYLHTGLITPQSTSPNNWFHIVGNWGQPDTNVLMTRLAPNLYSKKIHIASYHGAAPTTVVLNLAFVFRNANGSLVGRSSSNNDILVPLSLRSPGNYISHNLTGNKLEAITNQGIMVLEQFNRGLRVHYLSDSSVQDSSYAVPTANLLPVGIQLTDSPHYLGFDLGQGHRAIILKNPLSLRVLRNQDTLFKESPGWEVTPGGIRGSFALSAGETLFGGGFRTQDVNQRGKRYNLYNQAQYGYGNGAMNLNTSIPFWVSSRGYGLLLDNHRGGIADLGQTDPQRLSLELEGGPARYWFIPGPSYKEVLEQMTGLTGRQELPPRWALGYIQSRYGYQTENEARSVVTQMQQQDFPLSALVLDLYWFGSSNTMGNLSWDYTRFPTPISMMSTWRNQGIKTILITETYFTQNSTNYAAANNLGYLTKTSSGNTYNLGGFWAGSSGLLDLTKDSVRPWFMNFYQQRIQEGVEGWWCDLGEPESHPSDMVHHTGPARRIHNLYSLIWAEWLHTHYRNLYPNRRLFNLIRSGYTGMQRYSTFPWTGDIQRSWSGLQAQIPAIINMGMSGIGYMHSDIGGFTGGGQNDELYARWQQFGAFQPIQRAHGEGVPAEPIFYPANIKTIVRDFCKLRMRLLPYNYTLAWENSLHGTPLLRPLFMENDNSSGNLSSINDQFMWGSNLMVAPVLQSGATSRSVVMPSGRWFDWWTDNPVNGGGSITASAPLNRMPLYVRGDAFVTMTPAINSTTQFLSDTLELHYYPSDSNQTALYTLYLDDGESRNALSNMQFRTLTLRGRHKLPARNQLSVEITNHGSYPGEPALRSLQHIIHRITYTPGTSIRVFHNNNRINLAAATSLTDYRLRDSVFWYQSSTQQLMVKYSAYGQNHRLEIGPYPYLEGSLTYANSASSPLVGSRVMLVDSLQSNQILASDTVDQIGNFGWDNTPVQPYRVQLQYATPWGGCNATDALLVNRASAGIITLATLSQLAADVNNNGVINSTDALAIQRRVAGLTNSFVAGDWVSETTTTHLINIKSLCRGDVNGSYDLGQP